MTKSKNKKIALTFREKQVLKLICQEKTTKEVAKKLNITEHGIEYHRKNLYKKTNSKTILGLLKYSIKEGIIKL